jgi:hypothetical protein
MLNSTNEFRTPDGINFRCADLISIAALCKDLRRIGAFLQDRPFGPSLLEFEDWLEHDGQQFLRRTLEFHALFGIIGSPRTIYEAMPRDDLVRIGIAPMDYGWYLRFYAHWDDAEDFPKGSYDITLPFDLAAEFREQVVPKLEATIKEERADTYFGRIVCN